MIPQQISCRSDTKSGITTRKLKAEVAVDDSMFNPVIEAISGAADILSLIWVRLSRSARVILARLFFQPVMGS
jgi:hypothetical protein